LINAPKSDKKQFKEDATIIKGTKKNKLVGKKITSKTAKNTVEIVKSQVFRQKDSAEPIISVKN
jgi:creatinine amidohydrolase/Fe(II)-dependent formamide hydrolase-like protein